MAPQQQQMPPPPKKGGIFGRSQPQEQGPDVGSITDDVNTISRRLRLLEEGFANMRRFFHLSEENAREKNKHVAVEIKTINSDISEVRRELQEVRDKVLLIMKELQTVARKEEVRVLEKYINLWNPIRFVTHNEVEQIIGEVIQRDRQSETDSKKKAK